MFFLCFRALSTQQGGYVRTTNHYHYYYYYYISFIPSISMRGSHLKCGNLEFHSLHSFSNCRDWVASFCPSNNISSISWNIRCTVLPACLSNSYKTQSDKNLKNKKINTEKPESKFLLLVSSKQYTKGQYWPQ